MRRSSNPRPPSCGTVIGDDRAPPVSLSPGPLLLAEEWPLARARLFRALTSHGFTVGCVSGMAAAREAAAGTAFAYAVLELRLSDGNGLDLVRELREKDPGMRIVVVTAHDSFATVILALRAGADDYLPKPVSTKALVDALLDRTEPLPPVPETPLAAARVSWEHVHRIFAQCGGDVRETARVLCMQRRSLRRILSQRAPPPRASTEDDVHPGKLS
jgi:two-component system response regulator RegA